MNQKAWNFYLFLFLRNLNKKNLAERMRWRVILNRKVLGRSVAQAVCRGVPIVKARVRIQATM